MGFCYLPPERVKIGCCCLPPDRVKLTVNSKKETNSRVKMGKESKWAKGQDGLLFFAPWQSQISSEHQERNKRQSQNGRRAKMGQESRWASVIHPLKESKWDKGHYELLLFTPWQSQTNSEQQGQNGLLLFTPWLSQTNSEQQKRNRQQGQNGPTVKMGFCYLSPERVKMGLLLFTSWKSQTSSEQQERNKQQGQNGLLLFTPWKSQNGAKVIMGCCCLPPDRLKLAVNRKKETNSRVKMGKGSRWASVIYPLKKSEWGLLLFTPWQNQTNSEQQDRNKQRGQNGQRVKMGQGSRSASVLYPLTESN